MIIRGQLHTCPPPLNGRISANVTSEDGQIAANLAPKTLLAGQVTPNGSFAAYLDPGLASASVFSYSLKQIFMEGLAGPLVSDKWEEYVLTTAERKATRKMRRRRAPWSREAGGPAVEEGA